jgi:hypothetical protein
VGLCLRAALTLCVCVWGGACTDTNTRNKKLRELVLPGFNDMALVTLLLKTSQLEYRLRNMFNALLKQKRASWDNYKKEASERMDELCTGPPHCHSQSARGRDGGRGGTHTE